MAVGGLGQCFDPGRIDCSTAFRLVFGAIDGGIRGGVDQHVRAKLGQLLACFAGACQIKRGVIQRQCTGPQNSAEAASQLAAGAGDRDARGEVIGLELGHGQAYRRSADRGSRSGAPRESRKWKKKRPPGSRRSGAKSDKLSFWRC